MNDKLPPFLLAESQSADDINQLRKFIVYTKNSLYIVEIFAEVPENISKFKRENIIQVVCENNIYYLVPCFDNYTNNLQGMMRRMGDWYKSKLLRKKD